MNARRSRQNRLGGRLTSSGGSEKSQKVTRGSRRNDVTPLTQGLRYRAACDTNIQIDELFIGHQAVNWVDRLKYLGLHFCCQKQLSIDTSVTVRIMLKNFPVYNSV